MLTDDDVRNIDVVDLAALCREQTGKYFKKLANDTRYCFELWCRACRDHLESALEQVFKMYVPILSSRARRHPAFYNSCQDSSSFAHTALANFYHAVNGDRFVEKFRTLPQVMAYLYTCLHTEILGDIRKTHQETALEDDPQAISDDVLSDSQEVWLRICQVLSDPKDQRLVYLRFVLEMKPAEIVSRYPSLWQTERTISIALYRIRRRLRHDPGLQSLAGASDETKDNASKKDERPNEENGASEDDLKTQANDEENGTS
jgi:hypothetical protein